MKTTATRSTRYRYDFPALNAGIDYDLTSPVAGWYAGESPSQIGASLSLDVDNAG